MYYTIDDTIIEIAKDNDLSSSEMCVLAYLMSFIKTNLECYPSFKTISENTRISERQCKRIVNDLKEKKLLSVGKKKVKNGKVNTYLSDKMSPSCNELSDNMTLTECQNGTTLSVKMAHNINRDKDNYNKKENKKKKGFANYTEYSYEEAITDTRHYDKIECLDNVYKCIEEGKYCRFDGQQRPIWLDAKEIEKKLDELKVI